MSRTRFVQALTLALLLTHLLTPSAGWPQGRGDAVVPSYRAGVGNPLGYAVLPRTTIAQDVLREADSDPPRHPAERTDVRRPCERSQTNRCPAWHGRSGRPELSAMLRRRVGQADDEPA
jgi:hypothetical protein